MGKVDKIQAWEKVYREQGRFFLKTDSHMVKVVKLFKKKGVKRVLDLGSGTGRHVVYLAKKGFDVYGFDPSRTGIISTKKWLKKEHLEAHLLIHDMNKKLPYKNEFFDAIIATYTLHHNTLPRIKKVIKELERVLKSKGVIFFAVPKLNMKYSAQHERPKKIGFRTYVPTIGIETGLPHFYFDKKTIHSLFHNFKILEIKFIKTHYYVIAVKK